MVGFQRFAKVALIGAVAAVAASAISLAAHADTYALTDITYNDAAHEAGFVDGVPSMFSLTLDGTGAFVSGITPFDDFVMPGDESFVSVSLDAQENITGGTIVMSGFGSGIDLFNAGGDLFSGFFAGDGTHCGIDLDGPRCGISGRLTAGGIESVPEPATLSILAFGLLATRLGRRQAGPGSPRRPSQ